MARRPSFAFDIDGTLTAEQRRWAEPDKEMIAAVRELIATGHDVTIWSGGEKYARDWCEANDLAPARAMKKPSVIIDNQANLGRRRLPPWLPEKFRKWFRTWVKEGAEG